MQFVKQTFMGIELDILMGHPDHDILFIATQVARAAGLKDPTNASKRAAADSSTVSYRAAEVLGGNLPLMRPEGIHAPTWGKMILLPEGETYRMLLRGHAPASEPFRKWVTEVVLPTIRKTGKFDVNEATDETSQQFAGEFASLHAKISDLEGLIKQLLERPAASVEVEGPYNKTTAVILSDVFNKTTYRDVAESVGLMRPAIDRLEARAVLSMEGKLTKLWGTEDGRDLQTYTSTTKRKWTKWPSNWLKSKVDRGFYRQVIIEVMNEKVAEI